MISGYMGVIPKDVRHHPKLKANAKVLYSEIMATLDENGICTKNNFYFSNVLNFTKETASRGIASLKNNGFINVVIENEKGTSKYIRRYITPIQNYQEVDEIIFETYRLKNLGVDNKKANKSTSDDTPPSENTQTMYTTINTINNIPSKDNSAYTSLNKKINDKQRDALYKIVKEFYTHQRERHPNLIKEDWQEDKNLIYASINVLFQLINIDNYEYAEIRDSIRWGIKDVFYTKVLISIGTLRNKSKNGFSKFQNLHHQYKNQ
tara:strand:+ start:2592 stop:3383 length:792 start_codon:yes stop_codon:yes gene_type:complete